VLNEETAVAYLRDHGYEFPGDKQIVVGPNYIITDADQGHIDFLVLNYDYSFKQLPKEYA
jgi:hypothetical protein